MGGRFKAERTFFFLDIYCSGLVVFEVSFLWGRWCCRKLKFCFVQFGHSILLFAVGKNKKGFSYLTRFSFEIDYFEEILSVENKNIFFKYILCIIRNFPQRSQNKCVVKLSFIHKLRVYLNTYEEVEYLHKYVEQNHRRNKAKIFPFRIFNKQQLPLSQVPRGHHRPNNFYSVIFRICSDYFSIYICG